MTDVGRRRWDPVTGLCVALALVPLTWVFGLEQFVPPAFLLGWTAAYVASRRPVLHLEVRLLLVFLVLTLGSASALSGFAEWGRWARGLITLSTGLAVLVLGSGIDVRNGDLRRLAGAAIAFLFGLGLLGAGLSADVIPLSFEVPLAKAFEHLPEWARSGFVGSQLATRTIGIVENDRGVAMSALLFGFPRFRGVFLVHGYAATAVLALQTWVLVSWGSISNRTRILAGVAVLSGFFVLVLASSRTALVLAAVMLSAVGLWHVLILRVGRLTAVSAVAGAVVLAAVIAVAPLPDGTIWERAFVDYRPGSIRGRADSYRRTFEGIAERPIFGWGTVDDDTSGVGLRAGTHSEPLNIAYRFGVPGGVVYLVAWGSLALAATRRLAAAWMDDELARVAPLVVVALGAAALSVHALFHSLTPDATVYWMCAALAGTVRACLMATMPSTARHRPTETSVP